jgi:DNA-binding transcriptional MerR regulator
MAGGGSQPGDVTGVSLSLGELAAASGCDVEQIRELERFGLLSGQRLGPDVVYGDDALRAAQLAARFRRHGIEARHLRQYRMAADKEVALFEQVVAPFLRQRDRSGGRAGDTLAELADLGEALHRALVRRGLREYLGGD